jgi:cytochrome P450
MKITQDPPYIAAMPKVTTFAEAVEILERNQDFHEGLMEEESFPFRGETVIELDEEANYERRKVHAPLFSRRALEWYERELFDPAFDQSLDERIRERDVDGVVRANLMELSERIFLRVISRLIGLDDVDVAERVSLLQRYHVPLNDAVNVKWSTRDHEDVIREGHEAKAGFIRDFYAPSARRRERLVEEFRAGRCARSDLPTDLLTLTLLSAKPEEDHDRFAREAILYLAAGVGTSSTAITFAVEELDRWVVDHPEDVPRLTDPEFLRLASNEVLRLRPTFPALVRRAVRDTEIAATGRRVRAGERIAIDNTLINRDPEAFGSNADRFDPYRSLPAGVKPYGLAFGAGPKVCIGRPLVTAISDRSAGSEIERSMAHVLKALYAAGVGVDHDRPRVLAPTAEDRYEVFPVRFAGL